MLELRNKNLNYNSPLRWTNLMLQCDASGEFSSRQHFHFSSATLRAWEPVWRSFSPLERASEKENLYHVTWQGMYHYWGNFKGRPKLQQCKASGNVFLCDLNKYNRNCSTHCLLCVWRIHPQLCAGSCKWRMWRVRGRLPLHQFSFRINRYKIFLLLMYASLNHHIVTSWQMFKWQYLCRINMNG